jgi:hypothetical protein
MIETNYELGHELSTLLENNQKLFKRVQELTTENKVLVSLLISCRERLDNSDKSDELWIAVNKILVSKK